MAQKARRKVEEKAWKKAAEEKKRKKRMIEYLQRLQDEMLEEEATLLEEAERSQVVGSKYKEIAARDKKEQ